MANMSTELGAVVRLSAGFMRRLQSENKCPETGLVCRGPAACGCYLEMLRWCRIAPPGAVAGARAGPATLGKHQARPLGSLTRG